MRRSALATVICLALGLFAGRAAAVDPAEVEELIRKGVDLRRAGRDPVAIPYFRQAYDLERSARTAAQLGLVEANLGYWVAAEQHLTEALSSPRHPWLMQHLAEIRGTLERVRANICELDVTGSPAGAEVLINGRSAGRLPLGAAIKVPEGSVQVTLRAPGYAEASSVVTAKGGGHERVALALTPAPTHPVTQAAPPPPPGMGPPGAGPYYRAPPPDLGLEASGRRPAGWVRPVAWVAASAAIATAAFGGYELLQQHKHKQEFDGYVRPQTMDKPCGVLANRRGGPPCDRYYADAQTAGRLAIIGFAAGGVLATTAIVAFVASSGGEGGPMAGSGSPLVLVAPGRAALGWSVGF
jgi:hypothetical protein